MDWLSSGTWQGVAGITALLTLAVYLYDRKKKAGRPDAVRYILRVAAFFVLGASYGIIATGLGMFLGDILSYFGVPPLAGSWGDLGSRLSGTGFGYWGFNSGMPLLSKQLGALFLWIGSLSFGGLGLALGLSNDFDFEKVDRELLFVPFFSVFVVIFIGLKGALT